MSDFISRCNDAAIADDRRFEPRRQLLNEAIYDCSSYSGVIPEHASVHHDPVRDAASAGPTIGDRAVALSRVAKAAGNGLSLSTANSGTHAQREIAALTARHPDVLGLAASEPAPSEDDRWADESDRYIALLKSMGLVPPVDDEAEPGGPDSKQPRKGGKFYPGLRRSGFGAENPKADPSHKGRLADSSRFGQRSGY